jgi:chemotaxis protein methyltransferase CheR
MKLSDFDVYRDLLLEKSGLVITPDKAYTLESRLLPLLDDWNMNINALTEALRLKPDPKKAEAIVDVMSNTETSFFRDYRPFEYLRKNILSGNKPLRIWSIGCSTGQEPYSIALLAAEARLTCNILATDLSTRALTHAQAGRYSQFDIQHGVPTPILLKYFDQDNESWTLKDDIKKAVAFKPFNLMDSMDAMGEFDVIFCRNVLSYFDTATKGAVLKKIVAHMSADGYLFTGVEETLLGLSNDFAPVQDERGIYKRK